MKETMKPGIQLHIEELVLHGFPPMERERIGNILQQQLTQLLQQGGITGIMKGGKTVGRLDAGGFNLSFASPQPASETAVGTQIAQQIHRSLTTTGGGQSS